MLPKDYILIVDDELAIRKMLRIALEAKGYTTIEALNKKDAIEKAVLHSPRLILLDLQLPDGSGLEVVKEIRSMVITPIIVLSVIDSEQSKIELLDAGADDYIVKPFSMGELLARIRTALRRIPSEEIISGWKDSDLEIDLTKNLVLRLGKTTRLTPIEFQILGVLLQNAGKVITNEELIKKVWGDSAQNELNSLRVHINQIRKKIENDPSFPTRLLTEPGIGYKWYDK
ncbi:transcriptional regulatory protein, C-terminal domain protein [Leptospira ryugenii]|uniref:Transcriptional regulatory protein, C-terminal domain protein n=1 Tax=Leptospira ryugenii TaxID=1917863 RepID=A0A2P2DZT3_9LEPT|nr:response regulator transcription factor [Leptospira ryugenii]GBF50086.1 transcriptional regulatory protein, C-terminal domain protein [Leptospira ryugenii]